MRVEHHVVVSAAISGLLFAVFKSWPLAISSFVAGIGIDIDHFFDYLREYGTEFNIGHFFRAHYGGAFKTLHVVFHGWEWIPVLAIACWLSRWNPWMTGAAIGWTQHLLADQLFNKTQRWGYFYFWRRKHKFAADIFYREQ